MSIILSNFKSPFDDVHMQRLRAKSLKDNGTVYMFSAYCIYSDNTLGVTVHEGDACDHNLVRYIISNITGVIHLATEVHSDTTSDKMDVYVEEQMKCFIGLLEILKDFKVREIL